MARKPRDHRAEYQRRKQIASESGFKSVRSYKRERKTLALPRRAKLNTHIRKSNADWSSQHSRMPNSRWDDGWDDRRTSLYWNAFTNEAHTRNSKQQALHDYLLGYDLITETEWEQNYLGVTE